MQWMARENDSKAKKLKRCRKLSKQDCDRRPDCRFSKKKQRCKRIKAVADTVLHEEEVLHMEPGVMLRNVIPTGLLKAMTKEQRSSRIRWANIFNDPEDIFDDQREDGPDRRVAYGRHPNPSVRQKLPQLQRWGRLILKKLTEVRPDLPRVRIGYMGYICAETHQPQLYHRDIHPSHEGFAFSAFSPVNIQCPDTEKNGSKWIDDDGSVQPMGSDPGDLFFMDGGMLWEVPNHTPSGTVVGHIGEAASYTIVARRKTGTLPSPQLRRLGNRSPIMRQPSPSQSNPEVKTEFDASVVCFCFLSSNMDLFEVVTVSFNECGCPIQNVVFDSCSPRR